MPEPCTPPTIADPPVALLRSRDLSAHARESGTLTPVIRGVWAPALDWSALAPWERYLARVHAAVLRHPDATFFLEAAAVVHGLPIFGDPGDVHAIGVGDDETRTRMSGGIRFHTSRQSRVIADIDGIRVPGIADTVVDTARARHPAVALAVADAALRMDPSLTVEQLVAINEARVSSRGRRRARWALHRASALPESPLESIDRAVIEFLGFPEPELQVRIGSDRVDKFWPAYLIAGEGDGELKYDGRFGDPRALLRARHERDARLFAHGVVSVPHWGWAEAVAGDPLHALLSSAGLPTVRPREYPQLHTLRRLLPPPSAAGPARTQRVDENTV